MYSLRVLEARVQTKVSAGWVPSGGTEGESVPPMPHSWLPGAGDNSWCSAAWRCITPSSRGLLFMSVSSLFLSLTRLLATGSKDHPNPGWSHLEIFTVITFARTFVPNQVMFWDPGWTCLLGFPTQLTTMGNREDTRVGGTMNVGSATRQGREPLLCKNNERLEEKITCY